LVLYNFCFCRYGEITNLNLVRDKDTGKQKGFCFVCYEDQRSTVLAVDNFNGTRVLGRILRVDHVKDYKPPKSSEPTSKIKTEKLDDDFQVKREIKTEIKQEVPTPEIKREICTPEIKREICTPEIKREICTPEIIRSPDNQSDKKKKKSKDKDKNKKMDKKDKSKEKDGHYKHQRDRSKEKDRNRYYTSEHDKYREGERSNKRPRYNPSQEKDIIKDVISNGSNIKSYNHRNQDKSREKDRKQFKDDRRPYKNKNYNEKDSRKHHERDHDYKK